MNFQVFDEDFLAHAKIKRLVTESPILLDAENSGHVLIFRRILEVAITQCRWAGVMARES